MPDFRTTKPLTIGMTRLGAGQVFNWEFGHGEEGDRQVHELWQTGSLEAVPARPLVQSGGPFRMDPSILEPSVPTAEEIITALRQHPALYEEVKQRFIAEALGDGPIGFDFETTHCTTVANRNGDRFTVAGLSRVVEDFKAAARSSNVRIQMPKEMGRYDRADLGDAARYDSIFQDFLLTRRQDQSIAREALKIQTLKPRSNDR